MSRPPSQPPSRRDRRAQARAERPAGQRKKIVRRGQASRPTWQSPLVLTSVGALLIGAAVIFASGGLKVGAPGALTEPPTSYAGLTVDGESVGSPTAPVLLEVFSDFQCPACKSFYALELPSLLTELVQPGLLRIESKDIDIIDPHSAGSTESLELTAGGFCAAEQNKYWTYHDLVYWNQGRENKGDHDRAFIDRVATAAGLDMTVFATCFARTDIRQPIIDATRAASAAGVSGTPSLRLNGQLLQGIPDYDQLHALVVQLAAQASPSPSAGAPSASPSAAPSAAPSGAPAAS
jgi:protein-disulfide isomerase